MGDNRALIKKIKKVGDDFIIHPPKFNNKKFSIYLSEKIAYDYSYMSQLFSKAEGETLEKYLIRIKIKCVKQLVLKTKLTFAEIAKKQLYCNLPHLCSQFKKVTGQKLSDFRKK